MKRAWLALLLAALAACSTRPGYSSSLRSDDAPRVRDRAYRRTLDENTRFETIYDGLDTRAFLAATVQSWPFRRRRVEATSRFLALSAEETAALLEREREESRRYIDFFVGLYTADSRWNDLTAADTIWRVELVLPDGRTVEPAAMERIARPDANVRALYPYVTRFWIGYRIRFPALDEQGAPLAPGEGPVRLRLASSVGRAEPEFVLRR